MKRLFLILIVFGLAACGSQKTADISGLFKSASDVPSVKVSAQSIRAAMDKGTFKDGELLVRFKGGVPQSTMDSLHKSVGATVLKTFANVANLQQVKLAAGRTVADAVNLYMADSSVEYAEPNYIYSPAKVPNDLYFNPQQWALQNTGTYIHGSPGADIKATGAWDVTTGSRNITVAVMDTGIDYTHPDLVGNMWVDRVKVLLRDMHWLGQDTFKIVGEKVIYTDPFNIRKPSSTMPLPENDRADIILISHDHSDHCSPVDVDLIKWANTVVVTTADCAATLRKGQRNDGGTPTPATPVPYTGEIRVVTSGSTLTVGGIDMSVVPAYNIDPARTAFHPRSKNWVGFVFRVNRNLDINTPISTTNPVVDLLSEPGPWIYFAGDTDRIPEMKNLSGKIDVALLPVQGTETPAASQVVMTAKEARDAALDIRAKVTIPMHYGSGTGTAADARWLADNLEDRLEVAIMFNQREKTAYTGDTVSYDNNKKIDDWRGWNFVFTDKNGNGACDQFRDDPVKNENCNDPWDDDGHGTHVAGTIGATGNNGEGVAGVNWSVELMPLKVCGFDSTLNMVACPNSALVDAIGYATFKGVKIINASLGGGAFSYALRDALVAAGQAGTMLIAAAGNGSFDGLGDNNDVNPVYPASYVLDNVIAVAATDQMDRRTAFSNFGLQSVHVGAPGQYILSTVPTSSTAAPIPGVGDPLPDRVSPFATVWCTGAPTVGYNVCSGTSMAAPHVTGLVALLYNVYPTYTYSQIRGMVIKYVDRLPALDGWIYSGGRINAQKAVTALLKPTGLTAAAPQAAQVTLSWNDNTGEDFYLIERKQSGSFSEIGRTDQNITSFTDTGVAAGTTYTYRVRAISSLPNPPSRYSVTAESVNSDEVAVTTPGGGGSADTGGGGGGGCSVGARQNGPTAVADVLVMLTPLLAFIALRRLGRRKK